MILRAKIIEIPAHLDWTEQNKFAGKRTSSLKVLRGFFSGLMSGFIFRPYIFFMGIGAFLMALSLYELVWLFYDTLADLANAKIALPNGENTFSNCLFPFLLLSNFCCKNNIYYRYVHVCRIPRPNYYSF